MMWCYPTWKQLYSISGLVAMVMLRLISAWKRAVWRHFNPAHNVENPGYKGPTCWRLRSAILGDQLEDCSSLAADGRNNLLEM
ncbi:hypothetical protein IWX48DRAFT_132276 [Phyllosticta citricarpa]